MELDLNKYPWINLAVQAALQPSQQQQPAVNLTQPNIPYPQIQQPPQYTKTQNPSEYEQNAGYFSNITPNFLAGVNKTDIPNRNALLDAREIFAAKKSWEDADRIESGLTEMLNDKNLTTDQKNLINSKLIDVQNVKKNSSDYANMLRNGGFNLYGFGAENTVGESAQALHNYQQRGMETLLNLPSYQERAFDKEMELAQNGMKPRDINFALEKYELPKIKREMANQYRDGVALYGMNPDGSLNEFGAEILSRMADVNPTSANAYSSLFANPKDTFTADQNMLQNIFNQDNANWRAILQAKENRWGKQYDAANHLYELLTTLGYDHEKHQDNLKQRQYEFGETGKLKEKNLEIEGYKNQVDAYFKALKEEREQMEAYLKTPEGKVEYARRLAKLNGLKEGTQEFNDYVMSMSSVSKLPTTDDHKKSANKLGNSFLFLQDSLYSGNIEKLKEDIQQTRNELRDPESDFKKQFTPYETWEAMKLLDLYEEAAEGNIGVRELGDKSYALLHPDWKPDPSDFDREPVWYWDMDKQQRKKYDEAVNRESLKQQPRQGGFGVSSASNSSVNNSLSTVPPGSSLGGHYPNAAKTGYGAAYIPNR